jgi:hypothetical protein
MAPQKNVSYSQFFYRENADKTIDAICGFCFLTAATANDFADLHKLESAHVCFLKHARQQSHLTGA